MFDPNSVVVSKYDETLVTGWRDTNTRLWKIPIVDKGESTQSNTPLPSIKYATEGEYGNAAVQLVTNDYTMHMTNSVYDCLTQKQLIKFYHSTMFSPVKKVLIEAAR
eukprot:4023683-Ditylum_brightwellii.AAC.1